MAEPIRRRLDRMSVALAALAVLFVTPAVAGSILADRDSTAEASSYSNVSAESMIGGVTAEDYAAQQATLHRWLMDQMPAGVLDTPIVVSLTSQEKRDLADRQLIDGGPAVVGRTKPISKLIRFARLRTALGSTSPLQFKHGVFQATPDGGFVWAVGLRSEAAGALRVHIGSMDLPAEADLYFFSADGQAFGPYSGKGPNGDGDFWTNTVFGSEGVLLLRDYGPNGAADLKNSSFVISELGHIGPHFIPVAQTESFCSFNVPCIENASCHNGTPADPAKSAVALMQWISGQFIYTCTGGLLADTVSTSQIPYFLTANHCISTGANATNLQTYFQFSLPCGSTSCPAQTNPGGIQRLGATIKATGTGGDYTLLQLNQAPPAGSVFLGWNNTPVANSNNTPLYRISHPAWAPQAWSAQSVNTSAPTCTGWPRGERIYSRTTSGGTEGGSSGSPVLNGLSQVVGQLSGACGTNTGNACDNTNNATVDGAFAFYWLSVKPYLDPGGSCVPVIEICNDGIDNDCDGFTDCADSNCSGSPFCGPTCSPAGAACTANSQCCSNRCKGPGGGKTCR